MLGRVCGCVGLEDWVVGGSGQAGFDGKFKKSVVELFWFYFLLVLLKVNQAGFYMAKQKSLVHPILFSKKFGVSVKALKAANLLDPILNSDTKLFIDPLLIAKSQNQIIKKNGRSKLDQGFENVIELLEISATEGDVAWRGAYQALNLDERSETGLGYGGAGTSGSSRPAVLRNGILRTGKEILTLGVKNPNMIPLMGLFEDGVGPDTLSDMTTNFILSVLCEISEQFCVANNVSVRVFGAQYGNRSLPENPFHPDKPVVLVPRDILRDLPLAADWSDVNRVIMQVQEIRDAVNLMFGNLAKASISKKKYAIRRVTFGSPKLLNLLIEAVALASENYDETADLDGYYQFRAVLSDDPEKFQGVITKPTENTAETLDSTVHAALDHFKGLIENNNMWELLWHGDTPRHERASQLLFFAVATILCSINNVDISPETNSGGGPVDFKFSTGFAGRLLVELKLSKGSVVHGYTKQLEIYKRAAATRAGIYVVIDVGGMGRKLRTIRKAKADAEARGELASEIVVIDARRRASASKRVDLI